MSAVLWSYYYRTTLVPPPAAYQILLNAAHPFTAATKAWVSQTTAASLNVKATLLQIPVGAMLHVQDHQYSDRWVEFLTTGAVIDQGAYVEVPIAWDSNSSLNLYNGPIVEVLFVTSIDLTTPPPTEPATPARPFSRVTLPPLWTVDQAKVHLRITDTAHDGEISQKLDAAQETVLAYLGPAVDATWTPATAPRQVKNAVLLLTTHYYEHRGDDLGQSRPDEAVIWKELRNGLTMYRDPALA